MSTSRSTPARRTASTVAALLAALSLLAACSSSEPDADAGAAAGPGTTAVAAVVSPTPTGAVASTTQVGSAPTTSTPTGTSTSTSTSTAISVPSTTAQYFVLYVKPDLAAAVEVPVAIARGRAGTTTLTDRRRQLPDAHYRVAALSIDKPGDADGDGIDDLTELADPVNLNALNPAPKLDARNGAVIVSDVATFANLSYQGNDVSRDTYLAGLEFMKFWIVGTNTAHPAVYFMNTNTFKAHPEFASAVGIAAGRAPSAGNMRGDVVYNPKATAPDGSTGTYRFAFQPSDAYSFNDIALAYELLVANMQMLHDNLLYYPFPQSALPLYLKEKARYDAYRVPVLVE